MPARRRPPAPPAAASERRSTAGVGRSWRPPCDLSLTRHFVTQRRRVPTAVGDAKGGREDKEKPSPHLRVSAIKTPAHETPHVKHSTGARSPQGFVQNRLCCASACHPVTVSASVNILSCAKTPI